MSFPALCGPLRFSRLLITRTGPICRPRTLHIASTPIWSSVVAPTKRPPLVRTFSWTWRTNNTPEPPFPPHINTSKPTTPAPTSKSDEHPTSPVTRENIYTIPNALTLSRILSCPVIGWAILNDNFYLSTSLLVYASFSDLLDGYLARRFNMNSVLGTILDPAADKTLMTTLTITLAMKGLLPMPLAIIILGRDVLLSLSAFYIRYTSLPEPKTFSRYWDFSIPSAEVRPTQISKYNTFLQLSLMLTTAVSPIIPHDLSLPLTGLQWVVAGTTIWSGLSYVFSKDAIRIVGKKAASKSAGIGKPPRTGSA